MKRVDGERPNRLMEWFGRALMAADADLRAKDKEKGESWRKEDLAYLFTKLVEHVNKIRGWGYGTAAVNTRTAHIHAIKVVNYALMIATRIAGDIVPAEAKPEKNVIREIIHPYSSHTESNVEFGPPIIAEEPEPKDLAEKILSESANAIAAVLGGQVVEEPPEAEPEDEKKDG